MNIVDWIKFNNWNIDCETLESIDDWLLYVALATSDVGGAPADAAWLALDVALNAAWYAAGCAGEPPEWPDDPRWEEGQQCQAVTAPGQGWYSERDADGGITPFQFTTGNVVLEILNWESVEFGGWRIDYKNASGELANVTIYNQGRYIYPWIKPQKNTYCKGQAPDYVEPPDQPPRPPVIPPNEDFDQPECIWRIEAVGSHIDQQGVYWTKYFVTNQDPIACPGSFYYWGSQRGPVFCPENGDCPAPDDRGNGGASIPMLPATTYYRWGKCEKAEDWGEDPETWDGLTVDWEIPQMGGIEGLAARLDSIADMISWNNWLRQPTCGPDKPQLEGRWVTAQWISDDESVDSGMRLRKRTRWRTKSSRTDFQLAEFFDTFWWDAGPVCVRHVGGWWGEPQVWAKSLEEGQRVIREIGREAGLDPDLVGEWRDAVSRNPRYGRGGRMRLRQIEGIPWISSREGPNMLPMG